MSFISNTYFFLPLEYLKYSCVCVWNTHVLLYIFVPNEVLPLWPMTTHLHPVVCSGKVLINATFLARLSSCQSSWGYLPNTLLQVDCRRKHRKASIPSPAHSCVQEVGSGTSVFLVFRHVIGWANVGLMKERNVSWGLIPGHFFCWLWDPRTHSCLWHNKGVVISCWGSQKCCWAMASVIFLEE